MSDDPSRYWLGVEEPVPFLLLPVRWLLSRTVCRWFDWIQDTTPDI